ncbi:MAG TPA: phosphate ABC transporter permease subunit PstC [Bacteroidales bacterium]|nr:phosphate ABC transporter permease subunit PstC [Bacteroidales bacterium]
MLGRGRRRFPRAGGRLGRDRMHHSWMSLWLILMLAMPVLIGGGLLWKSWSLLHDHALGELLLSTRWRPLSGEFGFAPFILSSLWVTLVSLLIAGPVCVLSAIHLTQYAPRIVLKVMQPVTDILAGIPSVIYGVWGIVAIVPLVSRNLAPLMGAETTGYSILSGAIVLAVMIIPFVLNILIEIFRSIPIELQEASLSLGASRWYTIKYVTLRKALPGIVSALGLGLSRAFGETIAVLMVVGNVTIIPRGVFQPGYPLPALIANNYGEMLSIPMYDSALMFGALILFVIVMVFNLAARLTIIRYEKVSQ